MIAVVDRGRNRQPGVYCAGGCLLLFGREWTRMNANRSFCGHPRRFVSPLRSHQQRHDPSVPAIQFLLAARKWMRMNTIICVHRRVFAAN
jgi:hypothetical protein